MHTILPYKSLKIIIDDSFPGSIAAAMLLRSLGAQCFYYAIRNGSAKSLPNWIQPVQKLPAEPFDVAICRYRNTEQKLRSKLYCFLDAVDIFTNSSIALHPASLSSCRALSGW